MPIHEFRCSKCHKDFEELVLSTQGKVSCPFCGSEKVDQLISAGAIRAEGIPKGKGGFKAPACMPGG